MKKITALVLALLMAVGLSAMAQDEGQQYTSDALGVRMMVDNAWVSDAQNGALRFWERTDSDVAKDGVRGYMLIYKVRDMRAFVANTYAKAEEWLNENCVLIGGVIAHEPDAAGTQAIYPSLAHSALGSAGDTAYTLMQPAEALSDELASTVQAALTDDDRFRLFDPGLNYGMLGAFDTVDLSGEPISHEYIQNNRLTIVNFWGTFCPPCLAEMPSMGKLAGEYSDQGVGFLGIVTDAYDADTLELARQLIEQTGANYPHIEPVLSANVLSSIQYLPTTIFLDSTGSQVGEVMVGGMDEQGWIDAIEERLALVQ